MKTDLTLTSIYGSEVFHETRMQASLSEDAFKTWKHCIETGSHLDLETANEIAAAMKNWALEKGATHYTHWFQPLTGATAEKHDSFVSLDDAGKVITDFTGSQLVRGESDASSFPSGGLRATFEARGYTAWDPRSFAFIKEKTLYIPTIFCSYSGLALDKKTPLLRSMDLINKQAVRILRLFGDKKTHRVLAQCGPEQEYFLVDKRLYEAREDLKMTGRTLFGSHPAKGQEGRDHYYGAIKPRVSAFMQELDEVLWRLGVPAKTKHNEVAPSQHELAVIYQDANAAADANQTVMEQLKRVADKHGFVCLLHEKPYDGVNGSGKHVNWSLRTDTGKNLFKPGRTPAQNAQFLLFLAAFVKGVDEYQDTLRATVATSGNEHRLGAQEAPPAIISIYLGEELNAVVEAIVKDKPYQSGEKRFLTVGIDVLPPVPLDNTDRNRTSPMAFTGNKFEFRMAGSTQSVSGPVIALNTIMAEELGKFADELENADNFQSRMQKLLRDTLKKHRRIVFNGNGYDEAWTKEAEKRGLSNYQTTMEALPLYVGKQSLGLFTRNGIYTEEELRARYNIHVEDYNRAVLVEARTMVMMARRMILPAVSAFGGELAQRAEVKQRIGADAFYEEKTAEEVSRLTGTLARACDTLEKSLKKIPEHPEDALLYTGTTIRKGMGKVRSAADALEEITDSAFWPFPVYAQLLYSE